MTPFKTPEIELIVAAGAFLNYAADGRDRLIRATLIEEFPDGTPLARLLDTARAVLDKPANFERGERGGRDQLRDDLLAACGEVAAEADRNRPPVEDRPPPRLPGEDDSDRAADKPAKEPDPAAVEAWRERADLK